MYGTKANTKDDKEDKEDAEDSEAGMKLGKLSDLNKKSVIITINKFIADGRHAEVKDIKTRIHKTCGKMGKLEMNMVDMMVSIYPMIIGQTIAWLFKKFVLNKYFKI